MLVVSYSRERALQSLPALRVQIVLQILLLCSCAGIRECSGNNSLAISWKRSSDRNELHRIVDNCRQEIPPQAFRLRDNFLLADGVEACARRTFLACLPPTYSIHVLVQSKER